MPRGHLAASKGHGPPPTQHSVRSSWVTADPCLPGWRGTGAPPGLGGEGRCPGGLGTLGALALPLPGRAGAGAKPAGEPRSLGRAWEHPPWRPVAQWILYLRPSSRPRRGLAGNVWGPGPSAPAGGGAVVRVLQSPAGSLLPGKWPAAEPHAPGDTLFPSTPNTPPHSLPPKASTEKDSTWPF